MVYNFIIVIVFPKHFIYLSRTLSTFFLKHLFTFPQLGAGGDAIYLIKFG